MRPTTRIWTPGRILALLAIGIVIAGLARQSLAHPAGWAKVPDGARAGQLSLQRCTYPTEAGKVRADCGTLVVRENRADPKSRLIAVPVTRIRSRSAHPGAPIFRLEGGPGRSNMDFPFASRYIDGHDLVLVGYRGVDGSARLDCPEVTDARRHTADLVSASALRASAAGMRACASRLTADGYDLAGYTLAERVDDLDQARAALGYRKVDLLSESFGTRVALVYAWRHRQSIERSVMIGANPPGHFVWQPEQTAAQLRRYATLCGPDPACRTGSGDLVASMQHTATHFPKRWGPFPIHRGNAELAAFFGLMDASSDAAPISAPMTIEAWRGDASALWFESLASALLFPRAQVWGDSAAMGRIDVATAAAHFGSAQGGVLRDAGSRFLWAGGELANAWPAGPDEQAYARMRGSDVPTLLIGGALDGATPAENATKDLLPHLSHGRQVILDGFGHTTDFWNQQVPAGNHLINTYFDRGTVDASRYVPQKIDFTPSLAQSTLAKDVVGALVGLALFALASLAWMAWRVRARGRLGRVTRVLARSVWAAMIGLGGWFAVTLFVVVVTPSVPVDAVVPLVGGMAVPVALASFFGWRVPTRSAPKAAGLAVALAGALVGGWLGLQCGAQLLALLTTLAGTVAGANLALIACDIAFDVKRRPADAALVVDRATAVSLTV
ncbi:alpha/beta hydrolase [Solirubrobacter ginsenosidimutans]|uniref:Alpha/beta hydrolase n=1 Tax=Solirubrobacter ginsenosidimutans TaxID=490573 RepID=A0A9X3RZF4_9ACTN|nr:alpha/beta hydrolase [Solirubrobacter ginsenosidimutans]MDA0160094.1 alpha/beta hydrolase [Solirubrobacter ginsenosidimutans]